MNYEVMILIDDDITDDVTWWAKRKNTTAYGMEPEAEARGETDKERDVASLSIFLASV